MAHYECSKCGIVGCFGNCDKESISSQVPTAVVPRRTPKPQTETPYLTGAGSATPPRGLISPVKSDGGSSSYYTLTISNKNGESIQVETGDVIRALVANDFSLGNIVKACRRVSESLQGRGKAGVDPVYDLNKIQYFAQEVKDHVIRSQRFNPN